MPTAIRINPIGNQTDHILYGDHPTYTSTIYPRFNTDNIEAKGNLKPHEKTWTIIITQMMWDEYRCDDVYLINATEKMDTFVKYKHMWLGSNYEWKATFCWWM